MVGTGSEAVLAFGVRVTNCSLTADERELRSACVGPEHHTSTNDRVFHGLLETLLSFSCEFGFVKQNKFRGRRDGLELKARPSKPDEGNLIPGPVK